MVIVGLLGGVLLFSVVLGWLLGTAARLAGPDEAAPLFPARPERNGVRPLPR